MEAVILNVESLPVFIREKFHSPQVSVQERDGGVIVLPVTEESTALWGLLADGKLSTEKFLEQKKRDKELEL